MKHGSLFSGIGGFDIAAEWMGWENLFHCEWNAFGQKVLHHYWPSAEQFTDITKTDFTKYANRIDILTGGFPCQPYSVAGKRKGKEDERHLWPQMLRAIREIKPRWVVGENVSGLINWNGGMVFHEVQTDLEAEGYEVLPFVLPACGVNAPHRRDRVWLVAYCKDFRLQQPRNTWNRRTGFKNNNFNSDKTSSHSDNNGSHGTENRQGLGEGNDRNESRTNQTGEFERCSVSSAGLTENPNSNGRGGSIGEEEPGIGKFGNSCTGDNERLRTDNGETGAVADTYNPRLQAERAELKSTRIEQHRKLDEFTADTNRCKRCERGMHQAECKEAERYTCSCDAPRHERTTWENFPTEPPVRFRNDGPPEQLDGITFSKWRNESIKAAGNAIVPQVVLQIFKAIEQFENIIYETDPHTRAH